jgi:hypothetical protein
MKKKRCMIMVLFILMAILALPLSANAAAKVKLNKAKLTLTVGKKYQLKLQNNKKKVKWSSSKKSVATVTQKGKVTAKKKGTAIITAKVGAKKYKCKVTVKAKKANNSGQLVDDNGTSGITTASASIWNDAAADAKVEKKSMYLNGHVVVRLTNRYSLPVDVSAKCTYYDENDLPLDYTSEGVNYLEPGGVAYLRFYRKNDFNFKSYSLSYEVNEGLKYLDIKSVLSKIRATVNYVNGDYSDYFMTTLANDGSLDCYHGQYYILLYDQNGTLLDVIEDWFQLAAGATDTKKCYVPDVYNTYDDLEFARYEVIVSTAYYWAR